MTVGAARIVAHLHTRRRMEERTLTIIDLMRRYNDYEKQTGNKDGLEFLRWLYTQGSSLEAEQRQKNQQQVKVPMEMLVTYLKEQIAEQEKDEEKGPGWT